MIIKAIFFCATVFFLIKRNLIAKPGSEAGEPRQKKQQASDERIDTLITGLNSFRKEYERGNEKNEIRENSRFRWEKGAAVILGVYTSFTLVIAWISWSQVSSSQTEYIATQRPYISLAIADPTNPPGYANPLNIPVKIENSGNTWPTHLTVTIWCAIAPAGRMNSNYSVSIPSSESRFVPPKESVTAGACRYSTENILDAEADRSDIYIGVRAIYSDTIAKHDRYVTETCQEIFNLAGDPHASTPALFYLYRPCPYHNCADDDCQAQGHAP